MRTVHTSLAFALVAAACSDGGTTPEPPPPPPPVNVSVTNHLLVAAAITAGSVTPGSALSGQTLTFTVPGSVRSLTWTAADYYYSNGTPIPDDLSSVTVWYAAAVLARRIELDAAARANGAAAGRLLKENSTGALRRAPPWVICALCRQRENTTPPPASIRQPELSPFIVIAALAPPCGVPDCV